MVYLADVFADAYKLAVSKKVVFNPDDAVLEFVDSRSGDVVFVMKNGYEVRVNLDSKEVRVYDVNGQLSGKTEEG